MHSSSSFENPAELVSFGLKRIFTRKMQASDKCEEREKDRKRTTRKKAKEVPNNKNNS